MPARSLFAAVAAAALATCGPPAIAADPESPEVKRAMERGVQYLRENTSLGGGEYHVLSALGMVKGGAPATDPVVVAAVEAVRKHCEGGTYEGGSLPHRIYMAGVSMMLLEAAGDPDRDRESMQVMLDFIIRQQLSHGGWYYPDKTEGANYGDTSISQYAALGMWTAERAGLKVPPEAWAALAGWQLKTRLPGGSFAYHPGKPAAEGAPRTTMTAAAGCNLLLCTQYLHGEKAVSDARREEERAERDAEAAEKELADKYKALKRREEPADPSEDRPAEAKVPVPPASNMTKTAANAADLLGPAYTFSGSDPEAAPSLYTSYLLYTCERLGALSGKKTFGGVDWYDAGSDWLIAVQKPDGELHASGHPHMNTAFGLMFLARATQKALGKPRSLYGGGLLKGGRGLPADLTQARFDGEDLVFERPQGDLSDLLLSLDDPAAADVPAAQAAILETVKTGDREALIAQVDRLRRLIEDPRPDVRAVALWALARGGGPGDVAAIYERLAEDPDAGVVREAHNALCVLARLPRGPEIPVQLSKAGEIALNYVAGRDLPRTYSFNGRLRVLPEGPFAGLKFDATDAEKAEAFRYWRTVAADTWAAWRDRIRPYDQRDKPDAPDAPRLDATQAATR